MASFLPEFLKLNNEYGLVQTGQRLLMAVSGGADSLCMAKVLHEYRRTLDPALELTAVYVRIPQVALSAADAEKTADFLKKLDIPLTILPGTVQKSVKFHCYVCAKERRKQIFRYAAANDYKTVAYGHNLDDYLETGFMNLVHSGHLESIHPRQAMFDGKIIVIRPLLSVRKKHIRRFAKETEFPQLSSHCKYAVDNRRESIRSTMYQLQKLNRAFIPNLRNAVNRWNELLI